MGNTQLAAFITVSSRVRVNVSELNLSNKAFGFDCSSIGCGSAKLASGSALALHDRPLLHIAVKLTYSNEQRLLIIE